MTLTTDFSSRTLAPVGASPAVDAASETPASPSRRLVSPRTARDAVEPRPTCEPRADLSRVGTAAPASAARSPVGVWIDALRGPDYPSTTTDDASLDALVAAYREHRDPEHAGALAAALDATRHVAAQGADRQALEGRIVQDVRAAADAIVALPEAIEVRRPADTDTKTIIIYAGHPPRIDRVRSESDGSRVFRHWVRREDDLFSILKSGILKAGSTSYVEFIGSSRAFIKYVYDDLQGVFITDPKNAADEPRVMNEPLTHWVDLRLPAGVNFFDLDGIPGKVLMVPQQPGTAGGKSPLELPIEIVDSSLAQAARQPTAPSPEA